MYMLRPVVDSSSRDQAQMMPYLNSRTVHNNSNIRAAKYNKGINLPAVKFDMINQVY